LLPLTALPQLIGLEHQVGDVPLMKAFGEEPSLNGECGDRFAWTPRCLTVRWRELNFVEPKKRNRPFSSPKSIIP